MSSPSADAQLLEEKLEHLRRVNKEIDTVSRSDFRNRAERLKRLRAEKAALEAEIEELKKKVGATS